MIRYKVKPWKHQLAAIERASKLEGFGFFFEMGCLSHDAEISVNINGKARKYSIEELYRRFNRTELTGRQTGINGRICVRSVKEDIIGLNPILGVYRSGEKEVFRIHIKRAKPLKMTADHKVLTKRGWVEAGKLRKGDMVACDTLRRHKKKDIRKRPTKPRYNLLKVGPHHPYAHYVKSVKSYRVEKHRLIYEAWENSLSLEELIKNTYIPNSGVSFNDPSEWHIHHIDHDPKNNDIRNLEKLAPGEHLKQHGNYRHFGHGSISWASFERREKVGVEMTYDISAANPYNSFVANGVVVHNSGKTLTCVNTLRHKYAEHGRVLRTIIFCPPVVRENWRREIAANAGKAVVDKTVVLDGTGKNRVKVFEKLALKDGIAQPGVFITNYESLNMRELFQRFQAWGAEVLVFDESQRLKTHDSKRTRQAIKLADLARYKYLLTGTPILNTPMDIWGQFRVLDGGASFDKNYFAFRTKYFIDRNAGMPSTKHFPKWEPRAGLAQEFNGLIYKKAMRVMKSECMDLPPIVRKKLFVELSPEQVRAYKQMEKSFIAYINDKACVASIALVKGLRLQQMVSGFYVDEDETLHRFKTNPRLKALLEEIWKVMPTAKAIVWASFKASYEEIAQAFESRKGLEEKAKDKLAEVYHTKLIGGMTDKARQGSIDNFQNDPNCRLMIANQAAAGEGVNLTSASFSFYFSRSFNLGHDLQSEARNHRGGSEVHEKITRVDLVAPGTIDEKVVDALLAKEDMAESILKFRESFK